MPLALPQIQRLLAGAHAGSTDQLVYAVLLLHADCVGNVAGYIGDIAAIIHKDDRVARAAIRRLVRAGLVTRRQIGNGHQVNWWHISAIRDDSAPPSHAA